MRSKEPCVVRSGGAPPRVGNPGEPFHVLLDCSGASSPGALAIWTTSDSRAALATRMGWLYLGGRRLLATSGLHARSSQTWFAAPAGLVLPSAPGSVGHGFTVQGVCGGYPGGRARLSNALTQTIVPR